jgi:hypothetical protein
LGPPQKLGFAVALASVYLGCVDLPSVEVSANAKMDGTQAAYACALVRWPEEHHVGVVGEEGAKLLRSWDITACRVASEPILLLPKPVRNMDRQVRLRLAATADERRGNDENGG